MIKCTKIEEILKKKLGNVDSLQACVVFLEALWKRCNKLSELCMF